MNELKIAVIGLGGIGSRHSNCILQNSAARLCAGVDVNPKQAEAYGKKFEVPTFSTVGELLSGTPEIDGVVVATPPGGREAILEKLLLHGVPILCEKPLSHNAESAERIVKIAGEIPERSFAIGYCHRFLNATEITRSLIQQGTLGELVWMNVVFSSYSPDMKDRWNTDVPISGGGAAIDNACHALDLYRHLIHGEVEVGGFCRKSWPGRGDDSFSLSLRSANGALGSIRGSYLDPARENFWEVTGTEATLRYDYAKGGEVLKLIKASGEHETIPTAPAGQRFANQMSAWLGSLQGGPSRPLATLRDGLRVCQLLDCLR